MKPYLYLFVFVILLTVLAACKKELSLELGTIPPPDKTDSFKQFISFKKFRLTAFYSDIPIDYIETDSEIKSETDLWGYVSGYLKDDINLFKDNGNVEITQNGIKMPGVTDSLLFRTYSITADNTGSLVMFLDNEYKPLQYRLKEFHPTYFIVSIAWRHGSTLYSRFDLLP